MQFAEITGWGKCLPPERLTNGQLTTLMDTSEEWIVARTGIRERRISHVKNFELAHVAATRALAAANVRPESVDMIIYGTTTPDETVPNTASMLLNKLGARNASACDVNAACTGFVYCFNMASAMIRSGAIQTALVIGSERLSLLMDWSKRESAILFGDGAGAIVLQASDNESGLVAGKLGCVPGTRELLAIPDFGLDAIAKFEPLEMVLDFHGREVFKNAVKGMGDACQEVLSKAGLTLGDVDLIIPHQANLRIIEALMNRLDVSMDRVVVTLDYYANTSTSSIPIALCEALEAGRVKPGMHILIAAFGAGLTWGATLIKWGARTTPLAAAEIDLPPAQHSALEMCQHLIDLRHNAKQDI